MSFLIFAAPIIFIIIFVIFIAVFSSYSKKYRRNLDNNTQMQLDAARENALKVMEEIKRIKNNSNYSNVTSSTARTSVQTVSEQNNQSTENAYQQYYNNHYKKGKSKFRQQRNFQNINSGTVGETPTLIFSKENLVRGLIAKEFLNKKYGGKN